LPISAATLLVWPESPNPTPPYADWSTAAQTIQAAVDAAQPGDTVLATNGVYASGGRAVYGLMTNRVAVDKAITVQSVNGPEVTIIRGYQVPGGWNGCEDGAIRCAYLANGALLAGFTLTNGGVRAAVDTTDEAKERSGGGVWCESTNAVVTNCVLLANGARSYGGGAYRGTLKHCILTGNAASAGGGVAFGALINCRVSSHRAESGGGTYSCAVTNCTLTANSATKAVVIN